MKERLDKVVLTRKITESREKARALIMKGDILVDGIPILKAGTLVPVTAQVELRGEDLPYVSRGGVKLEAALDHFTIDLRGATAMDVGSSTGGFTDCMLKRGAKKVYCVDVGYGQLAWALRNDPRVVLLERTNIRHLNRESISDTIDMAAIDVSFISLRLILSRVTEFIGEGGGILALVKPQFEVGKGEVGKGGIVREEHKRLAAVEAVRSHAEGLGLRIPGFLESPLRGQKGNIEYFLYMRRNHG